MHGALPKYFFGDSLSDLYTLKSVFLFRLFASPALDNDNGIVENKANSIVIPIRIPIQIHAYVYSSMNIHLKLFKTSKLIRT